MRQAQQNRRGRGRNNNNNNNNNNRKSQNPLTRSFESNGPDVKIRGTPSHIAEKYVTMARDALTSGDPVLAENYLQHAEHYNRIIMTHREQQTADSTQGSHNAISRHRNAGEPVDNDIAAEDGSENAAAEASAPRGSEPQPNIPTSDRSTEERRPQRRTPRRDRSGDRDRGDRASAPSANASLAANAGAVEAEGAPEAEQPVAATGRPARGGRRTRYAQTDDQPEFLKRPVRRPRAPPEEVEEKPPVENNDAAE
jgi:hypothetical protein